MLDRRGFEARVFSYYLPLRRVREYVEGHLGEPIPLRAAARAAGLEEKYFSAFFHRKTGVCFRDWLAGRRVERAIEILTEHDDTITCVAASVGFQDLRTFERAFKRHTGLTPRAFKRSVAPEIEPLPEPPAAVAEAPAPEPASEPVAAQAPAAAARRRLAPVPQRAEPQKLVTLPVFPVMVTAAPLSRASPA